MQVRPRNHVPVASNSRVCSLFQHGRARASTKHMDRMQVIRSWRSATEIAEALGELEPLASFAASWDAASYRACSHSVAALRQDMQLLRCGELLCCTAVDIRRPAHRFRNSGPCRAETHGMRAAHREWTAQLADVPDVQRAGVLELDTARLKAGLATKLRSAQASAMMLLLAAVRREARGAISELCTLTECVQRALVASVSRLAPSAPAKRGAALLAFWVAQAAAASAEHAVRLFGVQAAAADRHAGA